MSINTKAQACRQTGAVRVDLSWYSPDGQAQSREVTRGSNKATLGQNARFALLIIPPTNPAVGRAGFMLTGIADIS